MNLSRFFLSAIAGMSLLAGSAFGQSRTIVIDAGHGGYDRGGVPGQRISEKDKTLDVAQRLKRILQSQGYRVIMTRDSDVFVSLGARVSIANSQRDATFVSIHFNCASRSGANGIETYYYRSDSAGLAQSIHRNVVSGAPTENRGIRRRGFYVLRRTAIPSVLVECGFLTNPTEGSLALSAGYRQKLAEQIARGIQRQPAASVRPLTASLRSVSLGNDFVRVPAESFSRGRKRSSKSARSHRSSKSKKSESSKPKKKKHKKSSED
ncbi:MAG TPA: N-acetylmuramoyl-L-alanine amidase [Chthoniobacterales bacterium]|jgi:N-acetylmuramoyl-L-alanine amidase|nr:N-acetylmuramoyl-L-alanine amidase [Chthoniobacterales bacterium]